MRSPYIHWGHLCSQNTSVQCWQMQPSPLATSPSFQAWSVNWVRKAQTVLLFAWRSSVNWVGKAQTKLLFKNIVRQYSETILYYKTYSIYTFRSTITAAISTSVRRWQTQPPSLAASSSFRAWSVNWVRKAQTVLLFKNIVRQYLETILYYKTYSIYTFRSTITAAISTRVHRWQTQPQPQPQPLAVSSSFRAWSVSRQTRRTSSLVARPRSSSAWSRSLARRGRGG